MTIRAQNPVSRGALSRATTRVPPLVLAVAIYFIARAFTAVITELVARHQAANLWTPAQPTYGDFVSMWDGDRYKRIAEAGYPLPFPVDDSGRPTQSEWAFFPAYPLIVRLLLFTGLPFEQVAPTLSLLLGAVAVGYAYLLFARHVDRGAALAGVGLFSVFVTAPVMQYAYSESTCLVALLATLYYLDGRRFLAAMPWAILLGLARPVGLAVLPVIGLQLLRGWRACRRGDPQWTRDHLVTGLGLLVLTAGACLTFPLTVAIVSGRWDGYTAVQVAWRVSDRMEYFTPWLWIARYALHDAGPVVLAIGTATLVVVLASPPVWRLGLVMWAWCVCYALYLAAVLDPFTSLPRFLLLFVPFGAAVANVFPPGFRRRTLVFVVGLLLLLGQVWWIQTLWQFTPPTDYPP